VVPVGPIRSSDQRTGVDDQHNDSVAAETVSEELLDTITDAVLARSDPDEPDTPTPRGLPDRRDVLGEYLGSEFLDRDPACCRGRFQTTSHLVRNIHDHRHRQSLRVRATAT
jgi:hypothetical protein